MATLPSLCELMNSIREPGIHSSSQNLKNNSCAPLSGNSDKMINKIKLKGNGMYHPSYRTWTGPFLWFGSWWIYFRIFESGLVFYFRPQNFHSVQYSIHTTLIHQILNMFTQSFKSHFHNIVSRHCVCDTLCHVNCILFSIVEKINI